jgi:hypothetical protein
VPRLVVLAEPWPLGGWSVFVPDLGAAGKVPGLLGHVAPAVREYIAAHVQGADPDRYELVVVVLDEWLTPAP